ncbi:MAG: hypothetical protein PHF56_20715 [Desulfuromonadaceae bacterium]|nr:hypothetical protein [Desulfuromonadaceae bacterium]
MAKHLAILSEKSSLPSSSISTTDRRRLQSLFDANVIDEVKSGAGRCLIVRNQTALNTFILSLYPSGLEGYKGDLPSRSKAVADRRDSKKAIGRNPTIVLVRGFNGCIFEKNEALLPVAEWTRIAGVASLCLDSMDGWKCNGTIGTVENLETFWHIEKIAPFVDLAIYAEGRIGADVLDWLKSPDMIEAEMVHFPDYDPVGMDEYLRIKSACPDRAKFFCPADLEKLFIRFGKAQLLSDNSAVLARLRKNVDSDIRYVVELMDRYGVGLEQEALLIDTSI